MFNELTIFVFVLFLPLRHVCNAQLCLNRLSQQVVAVNGLGLNQPIAVCTVCHTRATVAQAFKGQLAAARSNTMVNFFIGHSRIRKAECLCLRIRQQGFIALILRNFFIQVKLYAIQRCFILACLGNIDLEGVYNSRVLNFIPIGFSFNNSTIGRSFLRVRQVNRVMVAFGGSNSSFLVQFCIVLDVDSLTCVSRNVQFCSIKCNLEAVGLICCNAACANQNIGARNFIRAVFITVKLDGICFVRQVRRGVRQEEGFQLANIGRDNHFHFVFNGIANRIISALLIATIYAVFNILVHIRGVVVNRNLAVFGLIVRTILCIVRLTDSYSVIVVGLDLKNILRTIIDNELTLATSRIANLGKAINTRLQTFYRQHTCLVCRRKIVSVILVFNVLPVSLSTGIRTIS